MFLSEITTVQTVKQWYRIATDNALFYQELSAEEVEAFRKSGASVIPALPPDIAGMCANRYEE